MARSLFIVPPRENRLKDTIKNRRTADRSNKKSIKRSVIVTELERNAIFKKSRDRSRNVNFIS